MATLLDLRLYRGNDMVLQMAMLRNPITGRIYTATGVNPFLELIKENGLNIWGPTEMLEATEEDPETEQEILIPGTYRVLIPAATVDGIEESRCYGLLTVGTGSSWRPALPVSNRVR